jgi:hypothetical protein
MPTIPAPSEDRLEGWPTVSGGFLRQEKSGVVKSGGYSAENNLSIFIRGGEGHS